MKKFIHLLLAGSISIAVISCQKEIEPLDPSILNQGNPGSTGSTTGNSTGSTSNGNSDISGTWKFISMEAHTNVTIQIVSSGQTLKTVTKSDYTTENNVGTVNFDGTNMISSGIAYSVNTMLKGYIYENGSLTDSIISPFIVSTPPSSGSAPYKKVGADSLTFQAGSSMMSGVTQSSMPGGAKYKIENGKLYVTQAVYTNKSEIIQGDATTTTNDIMMKLVFQRP